MHRRHFVRASIAVSGGLLLPGLASSHPEPERNKPLDAHAYHRLRRQVDTPFGRIAYVAYGHGPVALFIHGFPLSGFQWRSALDRLGDRRRCLAPDLMGLGYTDVSEDQDLAPGAQAKMLMSLLDRLSIQTVDLVANDSGGTIAQIIARPRRPSHSRRRGAGRRPGHPTRVVRAGGSGDPDGLRCRREQSARSDA